MRRAIFLATYCIALLAANAQENLYFGELITAKEYKITFIQELDLDRLAEAVAVAETGGCTRGSGITKNNCFGIMTWKTGSRKLVAFNSKQASYEHFKELWVRKYGGECPTRSHANKWTGKDRADTWLEHVYSVYDCRNTIPVA